MNIRKPWKQTPSYKGEEKAESYNFFDISSFFRFDTHRNALGVLSDQTCSDLGFEDLLCFPTAPPHASGSSICTT